MMARHGSDFHERSSAAYRRERTARPPRPKLCGTCSGHGDVPCLDVFHPADCVELCPDCVGFGVLNP